MKFNYLILLFFITTSMCAQHDPMLDQLDKIDFHTVDVEVAVLPHQKKVEGSVNYTFSILKETDSVYLDAKNMQFTSVLLNGEPVGYNNDKARLWIKHSFQPSKDNVLTISYNVEPSQTMYFINWNTRDEVSAVKQVWTQGQGRYTSYWLPVTDDVRDKAVYNLSIRFRNGYEVIANGLLREKLRVNDSVTQWVYTMEKPMSSYLVALAAGTFEYENYNTTSGIPVTHYYEPGDKDMVEATYRHSGELFDFLENEIGYPYPWQNYKQVPVRDFLYSGMENTGTTLFSRSLMVDPVGYNDQNYVGVNAHELAHQWFGNLITASSSEHHWLQEGFATYYALLAEREIFGDDYYYWKLFQSAEELKELSDRGKGESLLRAGASSLTYYQKGAWAIHILRERLGETAFKQGVQNFLEKYAFREVTSEDFILEMQDASGKDLSDFIGDWLHQSAFQGTEALTSLKKSAFIREYMEVAGLRRVPFDDKRELLERALNFPVNDYIGQEAVYQLAGETSPAALDLYIKAFETGNLYVRQAIALSKEKIPEELKPKFIGLLDDESYLTMENTLMKLWMQYPGEVQRWLDKTEGIQGFTNKNVRMLWLVANLVSPAVNSDKTEEFFNELSGYTATYYPFEVRQNAFNYLYQLNAFKDQNLIDLIKAGQHHTSRFRTFSRELLAHLVKEKEYRERLEGLKGHLDEKDLNFLNNRLNL